MLANNDQLFLSIPLETIEGVVRKVLAEEREREKTMAIGDLPYDHSQWPDDKLISQAQVMKAKHLTSYTIFSVYRRDKGLEPKGGSGKTTLYLGSDLKRLFDNKSVRSKINN